MTKDKLLWRIWINGYLTKLNEDLQVARRMVRVRVEYRFEFEDLTPEAQAEIRAQFEREKSLFFHSFLTSGPVG